MRTTTLPLASVMPIGGSDITSEFAEEIAEFGDKGPQPEGPAGCVKGCVAERVHDEDQPQRESVENRRPPPEGITTTKHGSRGTNSTGDRHFGFYAKHKLCTMLPPCMHAPVAAASAQILMMIIAEWHCEISIDIRAVTSFQSR